MGYNKTMKKKQCECVECGDKNPLNFYLSASKSRCKACSMRRAMYLRQSIPGYKEKQRERYRRWYEKNGRKERSPAYQDITILWRKNHPESCKASEAVLIAIKQGLLERPFECALCGRVRCRINAHHEDYNFPYEVMWVCSSCHKNMHLDKVT